MNRTELLNYLKGLANTGKTLSGQHLDESDPQGSYTSLVAPLPDVPAILGGSPRVGQDDDRRPNETLFSIMRDHATAGGIVELEAHFAYPWAPVGQQHIGSAWQSGAKPDLTPLAQSNGVTPQYLSFWAQVDRLVDGIKTLPDNAMLIIRLLHEANGEHFWWGYEPTRPDKNQQQIKLYTQLKTYIEARIRQKPLWMHCGASASWYAPCNYGRPDWVDLVGATLYDDNLAWIHPADLTDLLSSGKPVFLPEIGPSDKKRQDGSWDTTKILGINPSIVGWMSWQGFQANQTDGYMNLAVAENKNFQSLYRNPNTITRSELNTSVTPPPQPPTPPQPVPLPTPDPVPVPPSQSPSSHPNPFPRFYGPLP